ncbi:hypothetical protein ABE042_20255 [Viridibacillus arvi]|uniref:hypothetical protein n=1 Tax=Viridibacillus arvi TaxID=263475 RepID=UPI003D27481B
MPAPLTTGVLRERISDMEIGDYIATCGIPTKGYFAGTGGKSELALTGSTGEDYTNYFWYMIKVSRGLLIADRVVMHTHSWDSLNLNKNIQGYLQENEFEEGLTIFRRSLRGGVAFADEYGNLSLIDKGYGAWPKNNEWDKHIVNFPKSKIQLGRTLDDVFHYTNAYTWCQETPVNGQVNSGGTTSTGINTNRISRGKQYDNANSLFAAPSKLLDPLWGFRPVFEYRE